MTDVEVKVIYQENVTAVAAKITHPGILQSGSTMGSDDSNGDLSASSLVPLPEDST